MMIFRMLCCCCFGSRNHQNDAKRLLNNKINTNSVKTNEECYTVHKISRGVSNDDEGAHSDYESPNTDRRRNNPPWMTHNSHLQAIGDTEIASDLEEAYVRTPQGSPVVKKRGHWGKVLSKAKKEHKVVAAVSNPGFQSLASVSMMMLPTITVGENQSAVSVISENIEDDVCSLSRSGSKRKKENNREVKSLSSSPQASNCWLKSQSMLNVNSCNNTFEEIKSPTPSSSTLTSTDNVAKQYGLDTSLYDKSHLSKSAEAVSMAWKSMENFDTNDEVFVDLANGTVHFYASYNNKNKKLLVKIGKIEGLAPKGVDRLKYDCIIKLSMLPHEKHTKITRTIPAHSTLDLDESFMFTIKEPKKKVLRISVFDAEFQGKYDAVGHVLFYVEDVLNNEQTSHVMKLYKQSLPDVEAGCIKVQLSYDKDTQTLKMNVLDAYNLPSYPGGKCKTYLKITQQTSGKKVKEVYSPAVSTKKKIIYNYNADFTIDSYGLTHTLVVTTVKIKGFLKKDLLVGRVILGPFYYAEYGKNLTPWGRAIINEEQVTQVFRMYV